MDIRKKTVLILCLSIMYLIFSFLVLSQTVVLDGFSRVEIQSAQKDTNRLLIALGNDINTLDAISQDWASREDTRSFLISGSPDRSFYSIGRDTFERLQFNEILLFDSNGTMVAGEGYDLAMHRERPVTPGLAELISPVLPAPSFHQSGAGTLGIIRTPGGPMMLAIRPVSADSNTTKVIGYILMGRDLDAAEVARLSSLAQLPLELQPYDATLPADFLNSAGHFPTTPSPFLVREGKESLTIDAPTYITPLNETQIGSYSLIRDIAGKPVLIMKVSIRRDIYNQGKTTTLFFVTLFIIAGLIIGLAILILLEKTVLSRVLFLSSRMSDIGRKRDFSARVNPGGSDEIRQLADTINRMLGELEDSKKKLQDRLLQSEEKYRLFFNSINDPVIIYRPQGGAAFDPVIEANDSAAALLGYTHDELLALSPGVFLTKSVEQENPGLFLSDETEGFVQYESSLITKKGKVVPVEINAWKFFKFGESAVLIIARDITDRKMAQRALTRVNKKLNLLNFVTFNDIQNILFTLKGYIALHRDLPNDSRATGFLEKEENLLKRFSQTLDLARNYQDLGVRPPRWFNVQQTFVMAISRLDFSRIHRTIELDNVEIFADPLLERVFFILAEQVLVPENGATLLDLKYQETAEGLHLFFRDNGTGIPDARKEKIFRHDPIANPGINLFLAREILDITGIKIRETGTFGQGTCFEITIPEGSFRFPDKKE